MRSHDLKIYPWAKAAGVSESAIRNFLAGDSDSLSDRTYQLLARAVDSTVAILQGEHHQPLPGTPQVKIGHYVGAGDEVHLVDGDESIDYMECPPGYQHGIATIVRGDSMRPLYENGDILFYRTREPAPTRSVPRRAVIVQVKDGPLYVKKLLPGTKKGRFHLLSINPLTPVIEDQSVESIARIGWVKPSEE
jgi:repressor LexA